MSWDPIAAKAAIDELLRQHEAACDDMHELLNERHRLESRELEQQLASERSLRQSAERRLEEATELLQRALGVFPHDFEGVPRARVGTAIRAFLFQESLPAAAPGEQESKREKYLQKLAGIGTLPAGFMAVGPNTQPIPPGHTAWTEYPHTESIPATIDPSSPTAASVDEGLDLDDLHELLWGKPERIRFQDLPRKGREILAERDEARRTPRDPGALIEAIRELPPKQARHVAVSVLTRRINGGGHEWVNALVDMSEQHAALEKELERVRPIVSAAIDWRACDTSPELQHGPETPCPHRERLADAVDTAEETVARLKAQLADSEEFMQLKATKELELRLAISCPDGVELKEWVEYLGRVREAAKEHPRHMSAHDCFVYAHRVIQAVDTPPRPAEDGKGAE